MKTTFDLPDDLVRRVKVLARERGTTSRDIVQQSLLRTLAEQDEAAPFTLTPSQVRGWESMQPEFRGASLHDLVLKSYEARS